MASDATAWLEVGEERGRLHRFLHMMKTLRQNRITLFGAIVIFLFIISAIFAPLIAPHDPIAMRMDATLSRPSLVHPLGTDELGRDLLSRIIHGARISLTVGIGAVLMAVGLGTLAGLVSGYYGGAWDALIMRSLDVVWAFPATLLALIFVAIHGASIYMVALVIGIAFTPRFARIARGSTLAEKEKDYIMAARAVGIKNGKILLRHILPNILAPISVVGGMGIAWAILIEASLSFLGLGTKPPTPSWGLMLSAGRKFMRIYPGLSIFPGLAIMLAVFGFNAFSDGLRDLLDPKLQGRREIRNV